jgi:putative SOS response-associated peptidase YedK
MCYHASVSATYAQLETHYHRPFDGDSFPSFTNKADIIGFHLNGFSFPVMPIIGSDKPEVLQNCQWGLIPSWTKDLQQATIFRSQTLNAKCETAFEKPSFKNSIVNQRCLLPITGFFEWKQENSKTKIPYYIHLKHERIFSLAGIYAEWYNEVEEKLYKTFSILTTEANSLMKSIHNTKHRMPAIIKKEDEEKWLKPNLDKNQILELLQPVSSNLLDAFTISPLISSKKHPSNVPEVLKPYSYERADLFS